MGFIKYFVDHDKQGSFVNKFREKRFGFLKPKLLKLQQQKGNINILDIGGDIRYWKNVGWDNPNVKIHLLNLYENEISKEDSNAFCSIKGNALDLPFTKGQIDLVFSNSVIEHVGSYENQQKFADEVIKLSDKYIIQTPSLWFPLEPHSLIPLFQFIPHSIRALLIMTFNINYFPKAKTYKEALVVSNSTLMFTKKRFQQLFPDAEIQVESYFGIPKSYTAIHC